MLPIRPDRRVAVEMIDIQNDDFGIKLEAIITKISAGIISGELDSAKKLADHEYIKELSDVIYKRLGLKTRFVTNDAPAAILPFYSNKNHIFIKDYFRGGFSIKEQDKLLKAAVGREGSVDLKHAKLGGIFTEYENTVYLNFHMLVKDIKLCPAEIVGVLLHELGHGFVVCEYSDRFETINQVLANVATEVLSGGKKKDNKYIFQELSKVNSKVKEEQIDALLNGNKVIAGAEWFKLIVGTVKEQLGNSQYSNTAFEQLADNFSSRFGYGKQTILALDKLHSFMGDPSKSQTSIKIVQFMVFLHFVLLLALITTLITNLVSVSLLATMYFSLTLYFSGEGGKDYTYDELKIRYLRIRADIVEQLKNNSIPKELVISLLDDLYTADAVIKETHIWSTVYGKLSNFLFSVNRNANISIQDQQLLEELTANDLFVQAARLKIS